MRRFKLTIPSLSFVLMHAWALWVFWLPFRWPLVALAVALYLIRMFAVTAGYHRYFSHRTFRLGRVNQFLLAFLAQTSGQKGVLWWAARHRDHHRQSDTDADAHSPITQGFYYSHVGWVLSGAHDDYDAKAVADFAKYPELVFLDRYHWLCPWALGIFTFLFGEVTGLGGYAALVWGFVLSTVALWHGTFTINSLAHLWGTRRFETADRSRNNWFLALLTLGEGWHNNHHFFQNSCRQGFRWWEIDPTYYALKVLSWVRIVRDIRTFPRQILERQRAAS
jgi:stearoyl-CoA desaturase (delta-9 desaturase)